MAKSKKTTNVTEAPETKGAEENTEAVASEEETKAPYDPWEDKVPFMIPKDRHAGDVIVSINGRSFLIKRGVPVDLPRPVYDALIDKQMAEEQRDRFIEENISAE